VRRATRADMTIDEVILKALEAGGPVTIQDIAKRFEPRIRLRLEKLRLRGVVIREGRGGAHRKFTYKMRRPDLAAKAIRETGGGLARAEKVTSGEVGGPLSEPLPVSNTIASRPRRRAYLKRRLSIPPPPQARKRQVGNHNLRGLSSVNCVVPSSSRQQYTAMRSEVALEGSQMAHKLRAASGAIEQPPARKMGATTRLTRARRGPICPLSGS
jgi:DNA-binding Lrp family transcriptional regulator